jgi:hypothetical protein
MHNEEFCNLYSSPGSHISENEIGETCCTHGKIRYAYRSLIGKLERKTFSSDVSAYTKL